MRLYTNPMQQPLQVALKPLRQPSMTKGSDDGGSAGPWSSSSSSASSSSSSTHSSRRPSQPQQQQELQTAAAVAVPTAAVVDITETKATNDNDESDQVPYYSPPQRHRSYPSASSQQQQPPLSRGALRRPSFTIKPMEDPSPHKSSHPTTFFALVQQQRKEEATRRKNAKSKPRSCLKQQSEQQQQQPNNSKNKKKHVKFATNSKNDRVWGFVKAVNHDHVHRYPDVYYWNEKEMEEIRNHCLRAAIEAADAYGATLRTAFSSCDSTEKAQPQTTQKDDADDTISQQDVGAVNLEFDDVVRSSPARGLEAVVARSFIMEFKNQHRNAVLDAQDEILDKRKASGRFPLYGAWTNDDLELIRQQSLRCSRPSRLIATKMGEFDVQLLAMANEEKK